ncbi:hypothetical protein B586_20045 [Mycobacterium haemophilum DSM 44634]|nr:PPE family protein [Mycobacterium haemophilum]ALL56268.1 hypothetical protein B586_20045 [Mycobacterium haemophilum DSM 44634]MCV7341507.1 PPE family protein [Mycobacterium haemophilum DSM 44634]
MRFDALTPAENATQLHGNGASSLFAAAKAWSALSNGFSAAAADIHVVLGTLPGLWMGAAATQMIKAAVRYLVWLRDTIARADVTAEQIQCIAVAYDAAQAAMVPVQTCADLRADIDDLIARDRFGEYYPVIVANEAIYHRYWENNARVMRDYAKEVATALSLMTPFAEAPQIVHQTKAVKTVSCLVQ